MRVGNVWVCTNVKTIPFFGVRGPRHIVTLLASIHLNPMTFGHPRCGSTGEVESEGIGYGAWGMEHGAWGMGHGTGTCNMGHHCEKKS